VGAVTGVFAAAETSCNLPYFADLAGTASCTFGGLGGVPGRPATACSQRNLLKAPDDPFFRVIHHNLTPMVSLADTGADRAAFSGLGWFRGYWLRLASASAS